jgi:hypothetical protein
MWHYYIVVCKKCKYRQLILVSDTPYNYCFVLPEATCSEAISLGLGQLEIQILTFCLRIHNYALINNTQTKTLG